MRVLSGFALFCLTLLMLVVPVNQEGNVKAAGIATTATARLVVFENFMRPTCGNSQRAGPVLDQLATEYAAQPVVILEYDVDNAPSDRYNRWWIAHGYSGVVSLPMAMVGSGRLFADGAVWRDFAGAYRQMINDELSRPPQAALSGAAERIGDQLRFTVSVTNLSNVTLSWDNAATVHVLVYEERQIALTGRYVRAAPVRTLQQPLAPGASTTVVLETEPLTGVQWDALRFVALIDYRPGGTSGAYEQLQAATLPLARLASEPTEVTAFVDTSATGDPPVQLKIFAPPGETWAADEQSGWLAVSPSSGVNGDSLIITIQLTSLSNGWQQGVITLTTDASPPRSLTIPIRVFFGEVSHVYLPLLNRS
ncbi:MAG: hypothetical protein HXY39_09305 [Chloroflexi bacterium]|nr:hypothetical protein [Chloroflexota bacterium]